MITDANQREYVIERPRLRNRTGAIDPLLPVVRCDQSTVKSGREPGRTEVKRGALRPAPASRATGVRV